MTGGGPRVAFFGSPAFALPVLDAIREHFEVVLVVAGFYVATHVI